MPRIKNVIVATTRLGYFNFVIGMNLRAINKSSLKQASRIIGDIVY